MSISSVFVAETSQNTVMLKKNQLSQTLKLTEHCNAQKIQNFSGICSGPAIDARILEFLEFFEHYSVS